MSRQRLLTAVIASLVLSALITPLQRELYVGDETKYGQVVREMRGGAFFLPTLHGTPFTHKPPLHFWAVDLLTYPFGLYSIWPFVIPSLIAFVFLLWLVGRMGGGLAAFICGTFLMIWGSAQTARMDVSFTAFLVLAAMLIRRFLDDGDRRALLLAGVAIGIATMIKGPMAPVIGILLLVFERVRRKSLPRGNYIGALLIAAAIPLLWFVPAMSIGGDAYTREVVVKQTAGRAVGSWVHKAAPWFYVTHAPGDLFPWFFLFVVALIAIYKRRDEAAKFYVSWMLAVFVPYTLMSSKLDIYMMALLPPAALLIAQMLNAAADKYTRWAWRANQLVIGLLLGIGVAGVFAAGTLLKGPEAEVVSLALVRGLFVVLALAAAVALVASTRSRDAITSTIAAGLVPIAALVYLAIALVPTANELASTRPLVRALQKQNVDAREISLFSTPQLWIRGMPRDLENVTYMSRSDPARGQVIVTSRRYADDIRAQLSGYRKVDEFRMIGKWFDVYRR